MVKSLWFGSLSFFIDFVNHVVYTPDGHLRFGPVSHDFWW